MITVVGQVFHIHDGRVSMWTETAVVFLLVEVSRFSVMKRMATVMAGRLVLNMVRLDVMISLTEGSIVVLGCPVFESVFVG